MSPCAFGGVRNILFTVAANRESGSADDPVLAILAFFSFGNRITSEMNTNGLNQAKSALAKCTSAFDTLERSKKLDDVASAWSDFLLSSARVYTKLKAGTKGHGISEAWFGRITKERKDDPLLQYIHQARNTDEHSIEEIAERRLPSLEFTFGPGMITETIDETGKIFIRIENLDKSPAKGSFTPPRFILLKVKNTRYGDIFHPPKEHLGAPLKTGSPREVASLALAYLERVVEDASKLAK